MLLRMMAMKVTATKLMMGHLMVLKVMATKVMTMQVSDYVESDGDEGHGDEIHGILSDKLSFIFLTGRRHDGDRRFIKWTRFFLKASWLNIRRKCCKACVTGTQEQYCLI